MTDTTAKAAAPKADKAKTIRVIALKNWRCKFIGTVYDLVKGKKYTIPHDVYQALTNPRLPGPVVQAV